MNMSYKDKAKQSKYQCDYNKKRREEFFAGKKCKKCGSTIKLELHHKNPKEKKSHNIWSWSVESREKELKKCIVLCKICHTNHHAKLKRKYTHGTANMYDRGCKCEKCKLFKKEKNKRMRLKKNADVAQFGRASDL